MITYELNIEVNDSSWLFSIWPTQGSVSFYINPDKKPTRRDDYKYHIKSKWAEEILITANQIKRFGFTENKFFILFKSISKTENSVFWFEVR